MPHSQLLTSLVLAFFLNQTALAETVVEIHPSDLQQVRQMLQANPLTTTTDRGNIVLMRLDDSQRQLLQQSAINFRVNTDETLAFNADLAVRGVGTIPGYACYRTVEQTYADLADLAAANPTLASWHDIGDSWEKAQGLGGHDVMALTISANSGTLGGKAPLVIIAAMHARELVTAETATRFAEHLINNYGSDPDITWILDHRIIHIVPQLNPDGRLDVEQGDLWRRKNADVDWCPTDDFGVDLNRNSSFAFGGGGSSGFSCDPTFRGPSAASEPEIAAIEAAMVNWFEDQRGTSINDPAPADTEGVFISLHSYGQLVLFAWEFDDMPAPNKTEMETLARKFGYYNDYQACQDCLYSAAGTTPDQAYGEYGVAAYTFELGTSFHQSCNAFENTIYPDNLEALVYAAKAARRPYQEPQGPEAYSVAIEKPLGEAMATLTAVVDDTRFDSNGWGNEPVQTIASVVYSIDVAPWMAAGTAMQPVDGTFDNSVEAVTASIDTSALAYGDHLVYVAATDSNGNTGVPTAVFLHVDDVFFLGNFD
ncbi:MAG: peptidase M14 [Lysobacteraceae bacterium]|nr:MAG: peptidase M14 [Xanthomonadaceae bacterium]